MFRYCSSNGNYRSVINNKCKLSDYLFRRYCNINSHSRCRRNHLFVEHRCYNNSNNCFSNKYNILYSNRNR